MSAYAEGSTSKPIKCSISNLSITFCLYFFVFVFLN